MLLFRDGYPKKYKCKKEHTTNGFFVVVNNKELPICQDCIGEYLFENFPTEKIEEETA